MFPRSRRLPRPHRGLASGDVAGGLPLILLDYAFMTDGHADAATSGEYTHDPAKVGVLAQLVDTACEGVNDIHDVGERIGSLTATSLTDLGSLTVRLLASTFHYMLSASPLGSPQPGATLSPQPADESG